MKKIIRFSIVAVLSTALFISGCNDFLNVNTDPTSLKTASVSQVLTSAEVGLTFRQGTDLYLYSSIFAQQGTGSGVSANQTRDYDKYILTNTDVNGIFTNYYSGVLADLDYLKTKALVEKNPQYAGISRILKAYSFGTLVDAWGDLPYKESLKGVSNVQPKYDASKEIYDSLFVLIDQGIANTKETNVRPIGVDDVIYGGNMARWERFANTLKLRLALHYAKDDAGVKLKAIIAAAGPFMTGTADNFQMTFENNNNRQNPIHQFEVSRGNYYAPSSVLVNMMNAKADPRRATYFTPYPLGTTAVPILLPAGQGQLGAAYSGTVSNSANNNPTSRIHTYLRGNVVSDGGVRTTGAAAGAPDNVTVVYTGEAPQRMLTFAEYNFIRAEAIIMYGAPGPSNVGVGTTADAQAYYQAGITASMTDAGVAGSAAAYIAALPLLTGTPADLQAIIEEKFVANVGVCMESWTDWRRTTFPTLSVSAAAVSVGNTVIPRILVYPLSEQQTNVANLPVRASMTLKSVFWDK